MNTTLDQVARLASEAIRLVREGEVKVSEACFKVVIDAQCYSLFTQVRDAVAKVFNEQPEICEMALKDHTDGRPPRKRCYTAADATAQALEAIEARAMILPSVVFDPPPTPTLSETTGQFRWRF